MLIVFSQIFTHLTITATLQGWLNIIPILQRGQRRDREIKELFQGHLLVNGREQRETPTIFLQNYAFNLYTELQIELILLLLLNPCYFPRDQLGGVANNACTVDAL